MATQHFDPPKQPLATTFAEVTSSRTPLRSLSPTQNLSHDLPAGLVVFLVALPLCLGVALASGAPLLSGLIAGVLGGLVIPLISHSPLSVSGPAAGLAAIVVTGQHTLGSFSALCTAVMLAGVFQIVLGVLQAGVVISFIPASVIRGMLSAIGLLLILKQTPHAIGYDRENFSSESFSVDGEGNTFSLLVHAATRWEWGAFLISLVSLGILLLWERTPRLKKLFWMPAPLAVVFLGTLMNVLFGRFAPSLALEARHLVSVPTGGPSILASSLNFPSFSSLLHAPVWTVGLTIAVVASLESLLSLEAVDRLDPLKRKSPPNRELLAQGTANFLSGLMGGLPITSVIVRSSANVNAGGKTQAAAFVHGILLVGSILFLAPLLNLIPLAALATILVVTGYRLSKPSLFLALHRLGYAQFIPFVTTVLAILFTDLLKGIVIGIVVGLGFTIQKSMKDAFSIRVDDNRRVLRFEKDIYFFHKAAIIEALEETDDGMVLVVDKGAADFVELDVLEILHDFKVTAPSRGIRLELIGLETRASVGSH